jgi:proteic killer suppression protein
VAHLDTHNVMRYVGPMIAGFRAPETGKIWLGFRSRRLPSDIQAVALRKLRLLNAARRIDDLRIPPGNHLEPFGHDRAGQWSIRINDQRRISFRWLEGGAHDVEIVDYHG